MDEKAKEDIELMLKVKEKDDEKAFEELYTRYKGPISNFFYRLLYYTPLIEDYTQEVFMRIWRARKIYQATGKFSTFIFQIAKNFWINEREKHKRSPYFYPLEKNEGDDDNFSYKEIIASDSHTPIEEMLNKEMSGVIDQVIKDLDEKHRLVFILNHINKLKYKEIAEILEIPIGTVKSRMSNAEEKLRMKLKKYFDRD